MKTSQHPSIPQIKPDEESALVGIGTTVMLKQPMANNEANIHGVIYALETADDVYYTSVILANGHDIGRFTPFEMETTFDIVGHTQLEYDFTTVAQLQKDYAAGLLDVGFTGSNQ